MGVARRTRILATLGPATDSQASIAALIAAGADAFRLNFSHGTLEEHQRRYRRVREASAAVGRTIAIVQDLGGPKIRTGPLAAPLELHAGETLVIEHGDFPGGPGRVSCAFDALFTSVAAGQRLLLNDGRIELQVAAVAPSRLTTTVVDGGTLDSHKGISVPNVAIRTPALLPKDLEDLRAGIALGIDLVAVSFVQSADDMKMARAAAAAAGAPDVPLIAKIEKPLALEHLDEILDVSDGVMVARGDLGIEVPLETLPSIQRRLVLAARRRGIPVIIATQVLESMVSEPRPTRAEVTDAAHAVDEGADAIMLSEETAVGRYPKEAVAMLAAIAAEAERVLDTPLRVVPDRGPGSDHGRGLCEAAVTLAQSTRASAVVAVTEAGRTARLLAALRPAATIFAATSSTRTAAGLSLVWGVTPLITDATSVTNLRETLLGRGLVTPGSTVVFVSMDPTLGRDRTNYVHVERL